jgi:uncharacterized protein YjiS (DUF1127 family)
MASVAQVAHPAADLLGQVARTLRAWARTSRERRELSGLDDRMLADIGIGRADVERERGRRVWQPIAADLLEAGRQERLRAWLEP